MKSKSSWLSSSLVIASALVLPLFGFSTSASSSSATTALVGCKSDSTPAPAEPLEIGTLTSVSGDLASLGLEFNDATNLAIEDINASGGVLDRTVKLVVEDDATSPEGATDGFTKLLAERVPAILGPTTSGQVEAIIDLIASGNTITIGRTTTADKLSDLPDNGYFFRLAPGDVHQTAILSKLVIDAGVEHLCLVNRRDLYGTDLAASVQKQLAASGKTVDITVSDYDPASADLSGVMSQCSALACAPATGTGTSDGGSDAGTTVCAAPSPEKVGLMLLTFVEDGALILDDAERKGWSAKKQHFFFSDGIYDSGLLTRVKNVDNIEGALGTAPSGPNPALPEGANLYKFVQNYKARYGREPSIFVENAFDSMYVAAIAIEIAKTAIPGTAIRDAMKQVSVDGGLKVNAGDWASIRAAIRAGTPINFDGASGTVDFDENGDVKPPYNYVVWTIESGALAVHDRVSITQ